MKRLLLLAFLAIPAAANVEHDGEGGLGVVVIPKDNSAQRAVEEMIRRLHEQDMQRRQHEYDMELERLRIAAEKAASSAPTAQTTPPANTQPQPERPRATPLSLDRTDALLNGRAWLSWPEEFKAMFIMGMYEGAAAVDAGSTLLTTLRTRASYDEIILGVDAMYTDPTNRVIPIGRMLPIYTAKTRGTPSTEIDAMISAALRAIMAELPAPTVPTGQAAASQVQ